MYSKLHSVFCVMDQMCLWIVSCTSPWIWILLWQQNLEHECIFMSLMILRHKPEGFAFISLKCINIAKNIVKPLTHGDGLGNLCCFCFFVEIWSDVETMYHCCFCSLFIELDMPEMLRAGELCKSRCDKITSLRSGFREHFRLVLYKHVYIVCNCWHRCHFRIWRRPIDHLTQSLEVFVSWFETLGSKKIQYVYTLFWVVPLNSSVYITFRQKYEHARPFLSYFLFCTAGPSQTLLCNYLSFSSPVWYCVMSYFT